MIIVSTQMIANHERIKTMVTYEQALTARDFSFQTPERRAGKDRKTMRTVTCRRNGQTKVWKTRPGHFSIPVKYGMYEYSYITHENAHEFTPA